VAATSCPTQSQCSVTDPAEPGPTATAVIIIIITRSTDAGTSNPLPFADAS
jgi:hypothetical protein